MNPSKILETTAALSQLVEQTVYVKYYDASKDESPGKEIVWYNGMIAMRIVIADGELEPGEVEFFRTAFGNPDWCRDMETMANAISGMYENMMTITSNAPKFFEILANHDVNNNTNLSAQAIKHIHGLITHVAQSDGRTSEDELQDASRILMPLEKLLKEKDINYQLNN